MMLRQQRSLTLAVLIIMTILVLFNTYSILGIKAEVSKALVEQTEVSRPADIMLITLFDPSCTDCFDISPVVEGITAQHVRVVAENEVVYSSPEGKDLVVKYGITKVPAVIVTGEIAKEGSPITGLTSVADALVYADVLPVYVETATGDVRGLVSAKTITVKDCPTCYDISNFVDALKKAMTFTSGTSVDASEDISMYNLTIVPAVILSGDLAAYPELLVNLKTLGTYVDGNLVLTAAKNPPYWDLATEHEYGVVDVTYITDTSCTTCYDAHIHDSVLTNYGVTVGAKKVVDVSSTDGKALVSTYQIVGVPTVLLSADAKYYTALADVWKKVGTVEKDGTFVFREISVISDKYVNLTSS